MTGIARLLAVLAGEDCARVPFVPNIWQWFHVNRQRGTLPDVLHACRGPVDALRVLGAEVMSKFDGLVLRESLRACARSVHFEGEPLPEGPLWTSFVEFRGATVRRERIETPRGPLTHTWQYAPEAGAPFEAEHWWKDFDAEYPAVHAWMEDAVWHLDRAALAAGLANVGDDGLVLLQLLPTPLKQFHWLAGPEATSFFVADHGDEMEALAARHEARCLAALEEVVDLDGVWAFEVPDNLDSLFYSPALFRRFCLPVLQKSARMVHARGKYLFIHACGRLKALAPLVLESELDCVEGQAHPPLGDWRLDEARALSPCLIVCGGMTALEQEWSGPEAAGRIEQHVRDIMASMGDRRRFLFGSGCNTSPKTSWQNLVAFRDAAHRYGEIA